MRIWKDRNYFHWLEEIEETIKQALAFYFDNQKQEMEVTA